MIITRVDNNKEIKQQVDRLQINVNNRIYTITEFNDGGMLIQSNSGDTIFICFGVRNGIRLY